MATYVTQRFTPLVAGALLVLTGACSGDGDKDSGGDSEKELGSSNVTADELANRAYIISKDSSEMTIIDLKSLKVIGRVDTGGVGNHMAELTPDFSESFVDSPETNESIVVDNRTQKIITRVPLSGFPTHISLSRDGKLFGVVEEDDNAVAFLDPTGHKLVKRVEGFHKPHFVRWAPDGQYAYVANIDAHFISKVDLDTWKITDEIPLEGVDPKSDDAMAPEESGFADVQIDADGVLHGADIGRGRVLRYDTNKQEKLSEVKVGPKPWIVYAEHPFEKVNVRVVPNWGDQTVSMIRPKENDAQNIAGAADQDSNGVNYTSLAPDKAFVMNRLREDIAVINTKTGEVTDHIEVGGNTETASTTPDGKWIVATVSSANRVVVIDAVTNGIVKQFDNIGNYPWSVTIPRGQNYCH